MLNFKLLIYSIVIYIFFFNNSFSASKKCNNVKKICDVLNQVVGIKTPMMIASGTIINENLIVTNRHIVEDHKEFIIKYNDGRIKKAFPLSHNFPVDLALLTLNKETEIPDKFIYSNKIKGLIRVVAYDQGRNSNRIYIKGKIISFPDILKYPQGRIHTTAQTLPGNSGGVAVDEEGNLVGIVAAGDGNINELIPIALLNNVLKNTNSKHKDKFFKIGKYNRLCADNLDVSFNTNKKLNVKIADNIDNYCWKTNNKQFFEQAGQTFGRTGDLSRSTKFLEKSVELDPMSPNSLLSLAITYHIDRKLDKERPLIKRLLNLTPENPQVLRLGVQVAGILKDKEMSKNVLDLMSKYNKNALPLAKKFIDNAFNAQKINKLENNNISTKTKK